MRDHLRHRIYLFVLISLGLWLQNAAVAQSAPLSGPADLAFVVHEYYFHPGLRCATCMEMERWTYEIIAEKFPNQLKTGILTLQSLNFYEERNFDFLNRYALTRPAVIFSKIQKSKEIAWNELELIWEFMYDEAEFKKYIETELSKFLRSKQKEPASKLRQNKDRKTE